MAEVRGALTAGHLWLLALALGLAGCAGPRSSAPRRLAGVQAHPLIGRIWNVEALRFEDERALTSAAAAADFVLIGEIHDNPEHHALEARLLRALVASGRRPAVAFEMLSTDQQPKVDAALRASPRDPDALAAAVEWGKSGWPDFSLYRPVFSAALDAGLPIIAANLPKDRMRALVHTGPLALPPALNAALDRAPLDAAPLKAMREEMREVHCGELPEELLGPLVLAQRARDAQMASVLLRAEAGQGAVLITGNGHARSGVGVPRYLAAEAPSTHVLSVALLEVEPDKTAPAAYFPQGEPARFDRVLFTPKPAREDPCEALRRRMRAQKR